MKSVNKTTKINTNVMENNETTTNNGRNKCTEGNINVEKESEITSPKCGRAKRDMWLLKLIREKHTHTTKTKHNIDGLFKTFRQRSLDLVSRVVYFLFIPHSRSVSLPCF